MLPTSCRCLCSRGPSHTASEPHRPSTRLGPTPRRRSLREERNCPAGTREEKEEEAKEGNSDSLRQVLRPELFPCGGSFNGRVPACFLDGLRSPKGRPWWPGPAVF